MRICCFCSLALVSTFASAASEWEVQDDLSSGSNVHRIEARTGSAKRQDVYGIFEQRLVLGKKGKPFVLEEKRKVAINCYTGRWDNLSVETYEAKAGDKPTYTNTYSIRRLETGSYAGVDIRTMKNSSSLGAKVWKFACSCPAALNSKTWPSLPESNIKAFFNEKVLSISRSNEFLVGYIRTDDQSTAQKVLDLLKKGEDFAKLADQYSNAKEFAQGVIPWSHESAWNGKPLELLRSLKPNQVHASVVEGVYGWEVYKLLDVRAVPAPTLEESREAIQTYLGNEKLCSATAK